MKWSALIFAAGLLTGLAQGVPHYLSVIVDQVNGAELTVNMDIHLGTDPITTLAFWDLNTNTYGCSTSGTGTNIFVESTNPAPSVRRVKLTFTPSTFKNGNGQDVGCPFLYPVDSTKYAFYVRTFVNGPGSLTPGVDKEFSLLIPALVATYNDGGSTTFTGVTTTETIVPLTVTSVTTQLQVTDNTVSSNVITSADIGQPAKLKFTMTVNPYEAGVSFAGARITNCVVDKVAGFNSVPITFIGSNGCFLNAGIFSSLVTSGGFSKTLGSSSTTGTPVTRTYIAYSQPFEVGAYFQSSSLGGTTNLYFRCDVTLCADDTGTADGTCGANHCDDGARKRRSVGEVHSSVVANVTLQPLESTTKECIHCSNSKMYKGTVAALGTVVALLFTVIIFAYSNTMSTLSNVQKKRREYSASRDNLYAK